LLHLKGQAIKLTSIFNESIKSNSIRLDLNICAIHLTELVRHYLYGELDKSIMTLDNDQVNKDC